MILFPAMFVQHRIVSLPVNQSMGRADNGHTGQQINSISHHPIVPLFQLERSQ